MTTHPELVESLVKDPYEILKTLTPHKANLLHMILGISGEAGELLDTIKKCVIYDQPLDVSNILEELGDIEFYLEGLRQELGMSREKILEYNILKLKKRYGESYSDHAAKLRADKQ